VGVNAVRPSDRTIRDVLRREAASVPIPEDLWKNISNSLDRDAARAKRRQLAVRQGQWRPAVVLAIAAGFFWFALIPALPNMESTFPLEASPPSVVVPAGLPDPNNTPAKATTEGRRRDLRETVQVERAVSMNTVTISIREQ
jgi:hypothetical protein